MNILPITIIIPTFNRAQVLKHTLPGYLALPVARIILVDDASADDTEPWVATLAPAEKFLYHRHPVHRGLPAARNTGLELAETPLVLFGEDDVIMTGDYVPRLHAWLTKLDADAVAGRLIRMLPGESTDGALTRANGAPERPFLAPWRLGCDFERCFAEPQETPMLHACSLMKRDRALAIRYAAAYRGNALREESDFYWRLHATGARLFFCSDAVAWHLSHASTGGCRQNSFLYAYWSIRNNHVYLSAHWPLIRRHFKITDSRILFETKLHARAVSSGISRWLASAFPNVHAFLKSRLARKRPQ